MAVLSQILGTSFGRSPAGFNIGGVRMAPLMQPEMQPAPTRAQMSGWPYGYTDTRTPAQSPSQVFGSVGNNARDLLSQIRQAIGQQPQAGAGGVAPAPNATPTPATPAPSTPTAMPNVSSAAPSSNGVMGSIMSAFNSGAGGGMDMSKLLQYLPMIMGAGG